MEISSSIILKCISCNTDPFSLVPTGRFSLACSEWIIPLALCLCWFWCFFSAIMLLHLVTADEASVLGFSWYILNHWLFWWIIQMIYPNIYLGLFVVREYMVFHSHDLLQLKTAKGSFGWGLVQGGKILLVGI